MDYGVTIKKGAKPWQIFAQQNGFANITLYGEYRRIQLSAELPLQFTEIANGAVTIKARIASEASGESIVPWTVCELCGENCWSVNFRVPCGGLYRVETYMEYEGWNGLSVTRGDMVHNIGVGDIFVIAGQSNAAGRAKGPIEDLPELGVHVLRSSGEWELATHPLGETTAAVHIGNFENHNPGHSPWIHFAKRLKHELGYPIGLVPCAYGGAPLRWWNPEENGALFTNMLEMLNDYNIKPKAVLWIQGEAEGYENSANTYLERFTAFVNATREKLSAELPFITAQINRCTNSSNEELDRSWGIVREAQRKAMYTIKSLATVPTNDLNLYDFIHNSSEANLVVGERCARAALAIVYGKDIDWQAPEPLKITQTAPDTIVVTFKRIRNWLNPYDVPAALLPFNAEDKNGLASIKEYTTGNDCITLVFERELFGDIYLHGAWRMNTGGLIPSDCMRMPMLSFYGMKIDKSN
ncbi:MAG: sialate O-acetylesterase [Christensenella sp.]